MDGFLKIAIIGENLIDKIDIINEIKSKYINQFIMALDINNMPNNIVYEKYWQNFDAVLFLGGNWKDKTNIINWLGHNHFRFILINSDKRIIIDNLSKEIDLLVDNIELEKKLLIEIPNMNLIADKYPVYKTHIIQTYLTCPKGTHRIRKRSSNGVDTYFETIKIRLTNSKCVESENIIDKSMYETLMKEKDPNRNTIEKDRYFILYEGNRFELDIYDFWDDQATIELEIPNEDYIFNLPSEIKLISDVSDDYMYKNSYLARLDYENNKTDLL